MQPVTESTRTKYIQNKILAYSILLVNKIMQPYHGHMPGTRSDHAQMSCHNRWGDVHTEDMHVLRVRTSTGYAMTEYESNFFN